MYSYVLHSLHISLWVFNLFVNLGCRFLTKHDLCAFVPWLQPVLTIPADSVDDPLSCPLRVGALISRTLQDYLRHYASRHAFVRLTQRDLAHIGCRKERCSHAAYVVNWHAKLEACKPIAEGFKDECPCPRELRVWKVLGQICLFVIDVYPREQTFEAS